MNNFLKAYLECMLGSSTDDDDNPLAKKYGIEDCDPSLILNAEADIAVFLDKVEEVLGPDMRAKLTDEKKPFSSGRLTFYCTKACLAGHDFWLSRNGHGTGFFDREDYIYGGQEINNKLQEIAKSFGELWPYVGDTGRIYT